MKLYSWWRSQASFRVRIALRIKGIEAKLIPCDIARGEHLEASYRTLNPGGVLPTLLEADGSPLIQSLAILEYLEETHPLPALLPKEPRARAYVRALAYIAAVDAHPYVVPRVRRYLNQVFGADEQAWQAWARHWLGAATETLETLLVADARTGRFCYGDTPSMADVCLVPHVYSATKFFGLALSRFPTVARIFENAMADKAFREASAEHEPESAAANRGGENAGCG
jgi:maleylacetoacetate isomerase